MSNRIKKARKKKEARVNTAVDFVLLFFVGVIPLILLFLYAAGIQIPMFLMGLYMFVVYVVAGVCIIVFAVKDKFGYGKEGYHFGKFSGFNWLNKKESKENMACFGGLLIAIGILFAGLTAYYCI